MRTKNGLLFLLACACLMVARPAQAALIDRVNEAYRAVYGRTPSQAEWSYWAGRVQRGEKTTFQALVGAMGYQKVNTGGSASTPVAPRVGLAGGFEISKAFYPTSATPNGLPDGTLVTSPSTSHTYYVRQGKKSWIIPGILNRWLNENHYFKHNIIINVSDADLASYTQVSSVNPAYVGKVLVHPNGTQFFIDDKLRRRELSASVRSKLKIPAGNKYGTSAAHINEFRPGPKLTGNDYPGGMVVYTGGYHGGRIWKFMEATNGAVRKHLYLSDYLYEADYNPDESHRAPAVSNLFDKHGRGANIERYPDGWTVGIGSNIYVVQDSALRLISSAQLFDAMGYSASNVRRENQEYLSRYPHGQPIRAYKSIVVNGVSASKGAPKAAPNTASHLLKVRPEIRALINDVNTLYIQTHGHDVTRAENAFWVDYLYRGEVNNRADLIAAMRTAAQTGRKPSLTPRTQAISTDELKNHWFPYLFYFVHQKEPSGEDRDYWFGRINGSDRNTIEKLGGTLQWTKDNLGATRR